MVKFIVGGGVPHESSTTLTATIAATNTTGNNPEYLAFCLVIVHPFAPTQSDNHSPPTGSPQRMVSSVRMLQIGQAENRPNIPRL